jgi:putative FmdB family regulatory protein
MPLYEYQCTKCGKIEEVIQKFSDDPLSTCRHCSGKLNKLISQSSFHLKGTGWYVTDYASKPAVSGDAGKDNSTKSTSEKKSAAASKTESVKSTD